MRKFMLLFVLVSLLLLPTSVQAQGDVNFSELTIQLWPEYDHPDMLVMYSFTLAADSVLPAEVQVRIPASANLNAVAKVEDGTMMNVPYDAPLKEGEKAQVDVKTKMEPGYFHGYRCPGYRAIFSCADRCHRRAGQSRLPPSLAVPQRSASQSAVSRYTPACGRLPD